MTDAIDLQHPIDRLPPQNPDAEEAVLGSILMDPDALDRVRGDLDPADFYRDRNGAIYGAMLEVRRRGNPVDFITLADELQRQGRFEEVGGAVFLTRLIGVVPTAVHAEQYAGIVRRTAVRRRLITAAGKMAAVAYDDSIDLDDAMSRAVELLAGVQVGVGGLELYSPEQQMFMMADYLERLGQGLPPGIPTGFPRLDRLTGGLRRGCLYVIGAPTGVGKTSWMKTVCRNARKRDRRVLFASSEMTVLELAKRDMASAMGRDWNEVEVELGSQNGAARQASARALNELLRIGCHVYHEGRMTTEKIRRRALRMQADGGLDLLAVDYLQRLSDSERGLNREQQVTQIARALKSMAVDLNVPVLVAAQFSRACTYREDKTPVLSDFRESGGIEQEADLAVGIYRESYFNDAANGSEAYLYVLKNRHGQERKRTRMVWRADVTEYAEYASEQEVPF